MAAAVLKKISWAGLLGTGSVFAFNSTEHLRMARQIQLGKVSVKMEKELLDPHWRTEGGGWGGCNPPFPPIT